MRWEQVRAAVERMLADGEVQRVPASREQSERLLAQARVHVASALKVCDEDPPGGYALAYDGARKALTAILENQGLRPTNQKQYPERTRGSSGTPATDPSGDGPTAIESF